MADTDDAVADDGQSIATTADTIAGPGLQQMALGAGELMAFDAVARESRQANNNEDTQVSPNNPQRLALHCSSMIAILILFPYRLAMSLRELSEILRLPSRVVYCKLRVPRHIVENL